MKIEQYPLDGLGGEYILTTKLEQKISEFLGVKHCILCNSGTSAIFMALRATNVKKVAIPNLTMAGTAMAAELAGCEMVLVGEDGVVPENVDGYLHVSLNGRACGIDDVLNYRDDIKIIEDACQSFGSMHNGRYLGTFGDVGCFSFSPHKILSAGNGGCVVTDNDNIALNVRRLKNFGRDVGGGDVHPYIGYNFKFTDIQADFVLEQFSNIEERILRKKEIYARYYASLSNIMREHHGTPWFVDVYIENRDDLFVYLNKKGVGSRKMYPLISSHPPFSQIEVISSGDDVDISSRKGLWLPSYLSIKDEDIDYVVSTIRKWMES